MRTSYQRLRVWKKSMDLVKQIHRVAGRLPEAEAHNLTAGLRRSVVAVPTNIAEGRSRLSSRDRRFHLGLARAALFEVSTQVDVAVALEYLLESDLELVRERIKETGWLLDRLIRSTNDRHDN